MRTMLNRGGNATTAPKMNHKLSSFSFTGALQILSPPSPKSENGGEILNKIEIPESNDGVESFVKKRIINLMPKFETSEAGTKRQKLDDHREKVRPAVFKVEKPQDKRPPLFSFV